MQTDINQLRDTVRRKIFEMSNAVNDKRKPIYRGLTQLAISNKIAHKCGLKKNTANVQLSSALSGANYPTVLIEANKYLDKLQETYRERLQRKLRGEGK